MNKQSWTKSSYSGGSGGNCIEVNDDRTRVLVRDTKNRTGPTLRFTPDVWRRLVKQIQQSLAQTAKKSLHRCRCRLFGLRATGDTSATGLRPSCRVLGASMMGASCPTKRSGRNAGRPVRASLGQAAD
jgi:hypothetical protein